ncbi:MAG: hypothetical protein ACYTG5_16935 [Planctomycetota bacterium]|jgi:hypothetical protein
MDILSSTITAVVTMLALAAFYRRGQRISNLDMQTGESELRYPIWFQIIAWLSLAIGAAALAAMIFSSEMSDSEQWACLLLGSFFIPGGIAMMIEGRKRIILSERGLSSHSPWTGTRELDWEEFEKMHFSSMNQWFVLRSSNAVIRAHVFLGGILDLVAFLRTHTRPEVHQGALDGFKASPWYRGN